MKRISLFIVIIALMFGCAGQYNRSDTKGVTGLPDWQTGDQVTKDKLNTWMNAHDETAASVDEIEEMIDGQTGTIQFQPSEGAFEDGDKTLLDSAIQPSDLATGTITPKTGDLDLNDTGAMTIGTDPDQTAGQLGQDTDGANLSGDEIIRATDASTNQWPVGQKIVTLSIPFSTSDVVTGLQVPTNESGMTFTITRWFVRSDVDDLVVSMAEYTGIANSTVLNELGSITASSNATGGTHFYGSQLAASMTQTAVETQHGFDFDISAAAEGWILIQGWFNANVD